MAEYFDFNTNINIMVDALEENNYPSLKSYIGSFLGFSKPTSEPKQNVIQHKTHVDKQFLKVRNSICVVGYNLSAIQFVKQRIASLVDQPLPLESLHIHKPSDFKEGALLVPKVILVATHCPGKKLIDDDGDQGQLDEVYDHVCDIGADILVVYLGLPRAVYKSVRHMVYHPRMAEILFPTQPTLRSLAEDYSLVTVLEKSDLTSMQKNVIREWLMRPVGNDHPVYSKSNELVEMTFSDAEFWSESELYKYRKPVPYHSRTQYTSASEYIPTPEKRTKTKKKKSKSKSSVKVPVAQLIDLDEGEIELEMYNGEAKDSEGLVGSLTV